MKSLIKFLSILLVSSLALSGCSTIKGWFGKRDNGSLDYQKSQKLDPIKLPTNQASGDFIPLYPTVDAQSGTTFSNTQGTQYQLPTPPKTVR